MSLEYKNRVLNSPASASRLTNGSAAFQKLFAIEAPDPIPHPNHIKLDARKGTVAFTGPMTREEQDVLDEMIEGRELRVAEIEDYRKDLDDPALASYRSQIEEEINHNERIVEIIDRNLGKLR